VSWQAVTFALLGLVLIGGFAWYERSRPPARLIALVAALAALAIAGRLVLTPIPNVVATTDIALITGYALGAAPGFAVGALVAPVSNIWLGQGPWTAWEMAGWGLVGLAGAWIAVLTHRGLGRLGLAVMCALAGLAYGALQDLSVMVTYGGEQSLDRYLALSARGIPFNVAHATGNFVIALVAGAALVRMISRYRTRLEFRWRPASAPGGARAGARSAGCGARRTTTGAGAFSPMPRAIPTPPAPPSRPSGQREALEKRPLTGSATCARPKARAAGSRSPPTGW
jgi:energy-coupling factor transport system substrate-specific component